MISVIISSVLFVLLFALWLKWRESVRAEFIRSYRFPKGVFESLKRKYPHLELKHHHLASRALRQYFLAHLKSGRKYVSMPSQAVDEVWHDFILNTREYAKFCKGAFGQFMHHTPAVVMSTNRKSNEGLRRCWWYVCKEENIDPRNPLRLPLLFAIDAKLDIADGFRYVPNCGGVTAAKSGEASSGSTYCGGDFSDSSFDGTSDGFGDSSSGGSADGSSDGGCGGGCGGGD